MAQQDRSGSYKDPLLDAYYDAAGNKSEAARALGMPRGQYTRALERVCLEQGVQLRKVADGSIGPRAVIEKRALPKRDKKRAYVLTSVQNNTHLHPGFSSLLKLVQYYHDHQHYDVCELMVGTYTYDVSSYGRKSVKRGRTNDSTKGAIWYPPQVEEHIVDKQVQLAPGLVWCGNWNILPTNKNPLADLEALNGRQSNVVPHAKMEMRSVPSMVDEATKFNYTTGTVSQCNYIQKRAGIMAESAHQPGALLVEVDANGAWFVRMLEIGQNNEIMDVGPDGCSGIVATPDGVSEEAVVEAITWGDVHVAEMHVWVRDLCWGTGGMLDTLRPNFQFIHDIFSMRSRNHHEENDFHSKVRRYLMDEASVDDELQATADFLADDATRQWTQTIIVPSNHHDHLLRWLNEADFRLDPANARIFCWLQYNLLDAIERGNTTFNVLEFDLRGRTELKNTVFLDNEESFVICKTFDGGVECGIHGHLGPNGARGSTKGYNRLGRRINKGHDHDAARNGRVMSSGACSLSFDYARGPNSYSISHIITYRNSARTIVTMFDNKWRA